MPETITHHADNWQAISKELPSLDPFTRHISAKAGAAIAIGKPGRKISETVELPLANEIRAVARRLDLGEVEGER